MKVGEKYIVYSNRNGHFILFNDQKSNVFRSSKIIGTPIATNTLLIFRYGQLINDGRHHWHSIRLNICWHCVTSKHVAILSLSQSEWRMRNDVVTRLDRLDEENRFAPINFRLSGPPTY